MKKLLIVLAFVFGVGHSASAQTDYSLISRFLNSVVNQDVNEMMDVLAPRCYDDINEIIVASETLGFKQWQLIGNVTFENGAVSYIAAVYVGDVVNQKVQDFFGGGNDYQRYISPSGHVFLYEVLSIYNDNGRKCVWCNGDFLSIMEVEKMLRMSGKSLPSNFYEGGLIWVP